MLVRFVGDIHGDYKWYNSMIEACPYSSVQVGDFGIGFPIRNENPNWGHMLKGNHRFIRGNHDDPAQCAGNMSWIPDGTIENGIAFIGGASSIDRQWRTAGLDWWPDDSYDDERTIYFDTDAIRELVEEAWGN